jgi:7-alpha-hydroxysteroid dehydrogenase
MPIKTFIWAYQLNVFSVFQLFCQLFAPHIAAAGGGAILNISSMAGAQMLVKRITAAYYDQQRAALHGKR